MIRMNHTCLCLGLPISRQPRVRNLFTYADYAEERQSSYFIIIHNRLSPLFSYNSTLHYDVLFYQ